MIVYLNGQFLAEEHAFVPVNDRGFLFGDGAFTTLKIQNGKIQHFELHVQKLKRDCQKIGISAFPSLSLTTIEELIKKNRAQRGVWRLKILISRGGNPELKLEQNQIGLLLITLQPYQGHVSPCRLVSYPYPSISPLNKIKSLSMLERLQMVDYALKQGFDDVLTHDSEGFVLETSFANCFWKIENTVFYPDFGLAVYEGMTLQMIIKMLKEIGMIAQSVKAKVEDIPSQAQLYLCNSMRGVVPITEVNAFIFERDLAFENELQQNL
jgi:branched-subunit amino acid aminotransferase/4-amino-4-deoxychorismate lyase